jgi:hypothetical protein
MKALIGVILFIIIGAILCQFEIYIIGIVILALGVFGLIMFPIIQEYIGEY